jgi:ribose transport system permease protein
MNTITAPPVKRAGSAGTSRHIRLPGLQRFSAVYLWIVFLILFGVLQFHLFLTVSTFQVVFSQSAVTAVLGLAFLVPLTTDAYDLSIGEMMSLTIVLMNWMTLHTKLPIGIIAALIVVTSALIGAVSGFVVVKLRVNSLIATLGMSEVLSSIQLYISQNHQVSGSFSSVFVDVGNNKLFGIPYLDLYMIVIALVLWFVLEQTPLGRRMFAVGGNREAARLAGISSNRIIWGSLIASAAIASVAGVMYTAQVGAYTGDIGQGYLFPALAAVFFGASQLSQRPNVWGTLIAFFALAFGIQGLTLQFGAGAFWVSPLFQGVALIGAVAIASSRGAIGNGGDGRAIRRLLRLPAAPDKPATLAGTAVANTGLDNTGLDNTARGYSALDKTPDSE